MAKAPIKCSIITPERQVLETEVTSVIIPSHDGQTGILENRAPLLCELGTGVLTVETADDGKKQFFVDGGFSQVIKNEVIVLTERAADADDLVRADAEKALIEAEQMTAQDEAAGLQRSRAIARAETQLKLAKH